MCGPDLKRHLKTKHGQQKSKEKRCSPTYRGIYAAAAAAAAADRGIYAAAVAAADLLQSNLLLGDQMYHLILRLFTTVADVIDYLEYIHVSENTVGENHY